MQSIHNHNKLTFSCSQFSLVCKSDYLVDLSTTIYMIGSALGAVLITPLSDRFGRKPVLLLSLWIQGIVGIGVAFVQSYIAFVITRFIVAFLNMVSKGCCVSCVVLLF